MHPAQDKSMETPDRARRETGESSMNKATAVLTGESKIDRHLLVRAGIRDTRARPGMRFTCIRHGYLEVRLINHNAPHDTLNVSSAADLFSGRAEG